MRFSAMAKGKKTGGRDFKKGEGGKKPLPEVIRQKSAETKPQIIDAYHTIAQLTPEEKNTYQPRTLIEEGILKCVKDFTKTGKTTEIRHIWAECHGKPKESVDVNMPGVKRFEIAFDDNNPTENPENISTTGTPEQV